MFFPLIDMMLDCAHWWQEAPLLPSLFEKSCQELCSRVATWGELDFLSLFSVVW